MSVEALKSPHQYTEIPERGRKAIEGFIPDEERIKKRVEHFAHVKPREGDQEGDTEVSMASHLRTTLLRRQATRNI